MIKQLLIASLAVASIAATSAAAQETQSVRIYVAGVDSHSENGARIILQRIKSAAGTVCGVAPSHTERYKAYEPCVREVTQRTVAGLHNSTLTAMFDGGGADLSQAKLASSN